MKCRILCATLLALACGDPAAPAAPTISIAISGGNDQFAAAGTAVANSPNVIVTRDGVPYAGATVRFEASDGGAVENDAVTTNVNGGAGTRWTLGATKGKQTLKASVGTRSVTFTATAQ